MWRIYKEGQGKWTRGILAFVVAIAAIFAVASLHESLPERDRWTIPIVNWSFDYRFLLEAPILLGALVLGVWLFNRPKTADFLIDTENELKNKVTWPSRSEEINASLVVVVTVVIMLLFIFGVDSVLILTQKLLFPVPTQTP
ncbi:MAG TPA: preprotein translocase subunit SecE [Planctomycetota bacterium]|nr:preprotein translocase subunit SecE [Planctomycetota bacterium]